MERAQTEPIGSTQRLRGIQLPPIQTAFPTKSHRRPQRPRMEQILVASQTSQSVTQIATGTPGRKTSRGLIPTFFGRNKSYRSARSEAAASSSCDNGGLDDTVTVTTAGDKTPSVPERAPFIQDIDIVQSIPRAATSPFRKRTFKGGRGRSFRKESTTWDPPPLFQAYPQAIKHATLPAPVLSTDAILRHTRSRENSAPTAPPNALDQELQDADHETPKRRVRNLKKGRGAGYDQVADGDWTQKVYVLVTSGFFLQYSGEGNFDRLPEKILSLSRDSAAFASDAIPGKRWVLQVAEEISENDSSFSTQGPSSVFKKLGFFKEARRTASNFLLVIDCPEEMDAWLTAVRKEIEALGGKKYCPDGTANKDCSEAEIKLQQKPSQRYLVKRDPQFSEQARRPLPHAGSMAIVPIPIRKDSYSVEPTCHRKSLETPSVSNTTTSSNRITLDRLRETPRMSYVSTGTKTLSISPESSPENSPLTASFCLGDSENPLDGSLTEATATPGVHRVSTQTLTALSMAHRGSQDQTKSDVSRSDLDERSTSPPNFSVPSFSKRYCSTHNIFPSETPQSARISAGLPPILVEEKSTDDGPTTNESSVSPRTSPKSSKSLGNLSVHYSPAPPPPVKFTTTSSPGELMCSLKSDAKVPRRFQSLAYSRGVSPLPALRQFSKSPHPPPTTALPAIPGMNSMVLSPGSSRHSMQPITSPAQEERNARRPISMQPRSRSIVRVNQNSFEIVSKRPRRIDKSTISSASALIPEYPDRRPSVTSIPLTTRSAPLPLVQPELQSRGKEPPPGQNVLATQTSLPLSHRPSPPSMPPLPSLPSIKVSQTGFRESLDGPWSSEYTTDRSGLQQVRAT